MDVTAARGDGCVKVKSGRMVLQTRKGQCDKKKAQTTDQTRRNDRVASSEGWQKKLHGLTWKRTLLSFLLHFPFSLQPRCMPSFTSHLADPSPA